MASGPLQVLALRRSQRPFDVPGVEPVANLQELFARADHLVLAAPLTAATRGLIAGLAPIARFAGPLGAALMVAKEAVEAARGHVGVWSFGG